MAPRSYNNESRLRQQAELAARIAAAAAELHAQKGAVATSYAEIAQRAGVSLPTVYKHFPTLPQLLAACTGHVASQAPALPVQEILQAADLPDAARLLVEALDRVNAHFEPWLTWREHQALPTLGELHESRRRDLTQLVTQALSPHLGAARAREIAPVWESLLHFELWHRLVREHKLSRPAARATLVNLLLAAPGPQPAASNPARPTRKKAP